MKQAEKAVTAACMDGKDWRASLMSQVSDCRQTLAAFDSPPSTQNSLRSPHVEMNVGRRRPAMILVTSTNIIVTSMPNTNAPAGHVTARIIRHHEKLKNVLTSTVDLFSQSQPAFHPIQRVQLKLTEATNAMNARKVCSKRNGRNWRKWRSSQNAR